MPSDSTAVWKKERIPGRRKRSARELVSSEREDDSRAMRRGLRVPPVDLANPLDRMKRLQCSIRFNRGETDMGDKGSKDRGKKEKQKKAQLSPKEKRRLKKEKKNG